MVVRVLKYSEGDKLAFRHPLRNTLVPNFGATRA